MDYDRVLVLDEGEMLEFGKPQTLLNTPGGAFRELCHSSADWPVLGAVLKG